MEDDDIAALVVAASRPRPPAAVAAGLDGVEVNAGQLSLGPPVPFRPHQPPRRRVRRPTGRASPARCWPPSAPGPGSGPGARAAAVVRRAGPVGRDHPRDRASSWPRELGPGGRLRGRRARPDLHRGRRPGPTATPSRASTVPLADAVRARPSRAEVAGGRPGIDRRRRPGRGGRRRRLGRRGRDDPGPDRRPRPRSPRWRAGAPDQVRPCVLCNQRCQVRDARNPIVSCIVEPSSGHESEDPDWASTAARRRSAGSAVLVVGGGPGGPRGGPRGRRSGATRCASSSARPRRAGCCAAVARRAGPRAPGRARRLARGRVPAARGRGARPARRDGRRRGRRPADGASWSCSGSGPGRSRWVRRRRRWPDRSAADLLALGSPTARLGRAARGSGRGRRPDRRRRSACRSPSSLAAAGRSTSSLVTAGPGAPAPELSLHR